MSALDELRVMCNKRMKELADEYNEHYSTDYSLNDFGNYMSNLNYGIIAAVFPKDLDKNFRQYYDWSKSKYRNMKAEEEHDYILNYIKQTCDMYEASKKEGVPFEWYIKLYGEE